MAKDIDSLHDAFHGSAWWQSPIPVGHPEPLTGYRSTAGGV